MNRKELKELSKSQLKGNWNVPVLAMLAYSIVMFLVSYLDNSESLFVSLIGIILALVIESWFFVAYPKLSLNLIEDESVDFSDLSVSKKTFFKSLGFSVLVGIILIIVYIVLMFSFVGGFTISVLNANDLFEAIAPMVIVGIILWLISIVIQLAISMVPFILADKEEVGVFKSISLSIKMMKGHKWRLFVIWLSFIGWAILSILTLGIGFLWLSPYFTLTMANFYKELDKEYNAKHID
ncbi:DUF975 family protein [Romboutsia sp. 1001216sp1]|uniref:DUF975 family protein n=1 Tax=unclassified Romboutsia TaxID=2626894 RepID=UPI0018A10E9F|nr:MULTISPECIES: DUF975 family protein [unclassified Romboutsia]MDB8791333.1 DUF975 family protein [Romboutsia sp. 1001216sp1]MDB8801759.1 DUF975 family protein [Romboutsia sp. 1001216sp1]MDB8813155.1 DUF975 family protein [Romboutsia sp. 1001216sp1]